MNFSDYLGCDATALAQHVSRGDTTPGELLGLALAQHQRVHGRVNAICRLMEEQARAQLAGPLAGPFAGVPFLIKDCAQDYAGVPTSNGSRSMLRIIPTEHAALVRAWAPLAPRLPQLVQCLRTPLGADAWADTIREVWR